MALSASPLLYRRFDACSARPLRTPLVAPSTDPAGTAIGVPDPATILPMEICETRCWWATWICCNAFSIASGQAWRIRMPALAAQPIASRRHSMNSSGHGNSMSFLTAVGSPWALTASSSASVKCHRLSSSADTSGLIGTRTPPREKSNGKSGSDSRFDASGTPQKV
ncbi:Uncharacterised protein [Mycobacteroides abscessus subsp. abscessus]|nr:Uncharacterised protein [Mycobacteroides abscessus subsp. abscessus]